MDIVRIEKFGQHKGFERVCLALASVIVNGERIEAIDHSEIDPDSALPLLENEDEFKRLREVHDISMSDHSTAKSTAREEISQEYTGPIETGMRRDSHTPRVVYVPPEEYWEEVSPEELTSIARFWPNRTNEFKKSIPDEKRKIINLLRQWKPWYIEKNGANMDEEILYVRG